MEWKEYNERYYVNPNSILKAENDCLASIIEDLDLAKRKCLDFGCGFGYWIDFLLKKGAIVIGVDASLEAVEHCRSFYPNCDFAHFEKGSLPYLDSFFEVITISWVFQEIYDHMMFKEIIREISRVLKPKGYFVIAENVYPNKRILRETTEIGDLFENNGIPSLLRFFPDNSLLKILERFGFKRKSHQLAGDSFFEIYECLTG